jgi:hypothetical protein
MTLRSPRWSAGSYLLQLGCAALGFRQPATSKPATQRRPESRRETSWRRILFGRLTTLLSVVLGSCDVPCCARASSEECSRASLSYHPEGPRRPCRESLSWRTMPGCLAYDKLEGVRRAEVLKRQRSDHLPRRGPAARPQRRTSTPGIANRCHTFDIAVCRAGSRNDL